MIYPTTAEIDLYQLAQNYTIIKNLAAPAQVMCVVKAGAYGHGAVQCTKTFLECGAHYFAVATLSEALELRKAGIKAPVLILGYTSPKDVGILITNDIAQTVFSLEYALELSQSVKYYIRCGSGRMQKRLRVHMKLNTGMNRLGFSADQLEQAIRAYYLEELEFEGVFTHFACSDMPASPMTQAQFSKFEENIRLLSAYGCHFELRHAANSAALINFPHMKLNMVRCGISLYGFHPSPETAGTEYCPVMTLKTTVSQVHSLKAGESVSYGADFTAERNMQIAALSIGYADGFIRAYAKGGSVYLNGCEAKIVGRICMDQCIVDITGIVGVKAGMQAVVFDPIHTADRFADIAGTINYEVVSLLTGRVHRIYI